MDDDHDHEDYTNSFEILSQRDDFYQESPEPQISQFSSQESECSLPSSLEESQDHLVSQISDLSLENNENLSLTPDDDFQDENGGVEFYNEEDDAITKLLDGPSSIPSIDFIKNLVSDTTEYNYFNNALMANWAGPEHWKFKQIKNKRKKHFFLPQKHNSSVFYRIFLNEKFFCINFIFFS